MWHFNLLPIKMKYSLEVTILNSTRALKKMGKFLLKYWDQVWWETPRYEVSFIVFIDLKKVYKAFHFGHLQI